MEIQFECFFQSRWGQELFVVGSVDELGKWDLSKAHKLQCEDLNRWRLTIELTGKSGMGIKYKYFIKDSHSGAIQWDVYGERDFTIPGARIKQKWIYDSFVVNSNPQSVWNSSAFTQVLFKRPAEYLKRYVLPVKAKKIVEFKINAPRVEKHQHVAILGNFPELGGWNHSKALVLNDSKFPYWQVAVSADNLDGVLEYKYLILNKTTKRIDYWEAGENRTFNLSSGKEGRLISINDTAFRYANSNLKGAGVSVPVFSLKTGNSFGVGDFVDLKLMIDWALKTGLKMVQLLPINDTISTHSFLDSYPYKAISVFALHPIYLQIFKLGKLSDASLMEAYQNWQLQLNAEPKVDYEKVIKLKLKYAKLKFEQQKSTFLKKTEFLEFYKKHKSWLVPYGAFSYLRDEYGTSDFSKWGNYKQYNAAKIKQLSNPKEKSYSKVAFWYYIQFYLHKQMDDTAEYARRNGVVLKGDIPIGISRYSVDAWSNPKLYHFDGQAGAPPDDFSVDGQNWGFPTYNWERMAKDNYQWWKDRLKAMALFFDAYRIDHILGFFRIWEVPYHAVSGILGHFRPALPISYKEFEQHGLGIDYNRYCNPYIRGHFLANVFEGYEQEARTDLLNEVGYGVFEPKPEFNTQRKVYDYFVGDSGPENLPEKEHKLLYGMMRLLAEVLLLPANEQHNEFHPRIAMHQTYSYKELDDYSKSKLNQLYVNYFYHRHEQFWKNQALKTLPVLVSATDMLVCGEDLGMIPATVPDVMNQLNILSLEIQRMPKDPKQEFAHPADVPYLSVCTTSTHDMSTIRGWWEENREQTQHFFNQQLGNFGDAPFYAEPWICKEMIVQHLHSPAMWTVFPVQDLLAMDGTLRREDTQGEQINVPANPRHYWQYKMHLSLEELLAEKDFNVLLSKLVKECGRS